MPFTTHPNGFRTRHWRQLYESHIPDLITMRKSLKGAVVVVIDAEPWGQDDSKPAEIGVSLLQAPNMSSLTTPPKNLDEVTSKFRLETHWICIMGRERQGRNREMYRFGEKHLVMGAKVELTICEIIGNYTKSCGHKDTPGRLPTKIPVILAGFGLLFEFRILSTLYPKVLKHFTSWVDLQEIASEVCNPEIDTYLVPSLRETLIACGFGSEAKNVQGLRSQHNAATDSVRGAGVLIHLLRLPEGESLDVQKSSRRPHHRSRYRLLPSTPNQKKLWNCRRPMPKEFFPYAARVYRTDEFREHNPQEILDVFIHYNPTAVGIHRGGKYGWVCLHDLKTLHRFIEVVDGGQSSDGNVWKAVSAYDPEVTPAQTLEEIKMNRRLKEQEGAAEKREQRRIRREAEKWEEDAD